MADRYLEFETLSSLFANTGIRHRYGVKPMDWYLERRGWAERTQAFLEGAEMLFIEVARKRWRALIWRQAISIQW